MMYLQVGGDLEEIILFKKYHHFNTWKARSPGHVSNIITEQLREMETREPEDSERQDQDLVFLVLVASLLCLLTGWCLFTADTQHDLMAAFLWLSSLTLVVSVVKLQLQRREKQHSQHIFILHT